MAPVFNRCPAVARRSRHFYNLRFEFMPSKHHGESAVRVIINGDEKEVAAGTTVAALLRELDASPKRVAVEVNRELVTRGEYDETILAEGDRIEIVTFVGGG